jgi:hypothetical protein
MEWRIGKSEDGGDEDTRCYRRPEQLLVIEGQIISL